ncbi:MAG: DUF2231 domain-containing protein [Rhodothermales bacterium]|nr:DUF2231 domain-containing protein [Rhodothermales bacterium]
MIPDWLPNIHPLIVHFPVALLCTAVLIDIFGLFKRDSTILKDMPLVLYVLGSVSAIIAYFTGRRAADGIDFPLEAVHTVNEHSDLALYTILLFGVYTLIRVLLSLRFNSDKVWLRAVAVAVPLVGLLLLLDTAEHGGELVFRHGIGVEQSAIEETDPVGRSIDPTTISRPLDESGGKWSWFPGTGAGIVLDEDFDFILGSADALEVTGNDSSLVLSVESRAGTIFFARGEPAAGLEMLATMDLDDFEGEVLLTHNVIDSLQYDYFGVSGERIVHGRTRGGVRSAYGSAAWTGAGSVQFKSVSAGTHYRGYVDGDLATHGHGSASPAGKSGILLTGSGRIQISDIRLNTIE